MLFVYVYCFNHARRQTSYLLPIHTEYMCLLYVRPVLLTVLYRSRQPLLVVVTGYNH